MLIFISLYIILFFFNLISRFFTLSLVFSNLTTMNPTIYPNWDFWVSWINAFVISIIFGNFMLSFLELVCSSFSLSFLPGTPNIHRIGYLVVPSGQLVFKPFILCVTSLFSIVLPWSLLIFPSAVSNLLLISSSEFLTSDIMFFSSVITVSSS